MALSFRKRIKIAKGLNLNLSKSGVGVSVGTKGASVSVGKNGTYVNNSIPGTGIYHRQKIGTKGKPESQGQEVTNSSNDGEAGIAFLLIKLIGFLVTFGLLVWLFW